MATEHAIIHLQLFHDNGKEVQYFLIDRGIDFEATAVTHFRRSGEVEAYQFVADGETIVLAVYDFDDIKGALKGGQTGAAGTGRVEGAGGVGGAGGVADADRGPLAALIERAERSAAP